MENKSVALVKALKELKAYVLHSHKVSFLPNGVVKGILTQNDQNGKRTKQIAIIMEQDIQIKPKKVIKVQWLAKLMDESNFHALDINFVASLDGEQDVVTPEMSECFVTSCWYTYNLSIVHNLQAPPSLKKSQGIFLKLKSAKLCILDEDLYWKDVGGILLNYLLKDEADKIMEKFPKCDS